MRGKYLAGGAGLGLALGAVMCAGIHPGSLGGPMGGVGDTVVLVVVAAAWAIGRFFRSGAAPGRRSAAREEVGEEVVWECDAAGRFTHASPQCLELLG